MPTILLRELFEAGFCGKYAPSADPSMGTMRAALDLIIAQQKFNDDAVQLCNHNNIPFAEQQFFLKCIDGIRKNGSSFNPTDVRVEDHIGKYKNLSIPFSVFIDITTGTFIEPVYDFYIPSTYIPAYSAVAAYLMGRRGSIKVDAISVLGDMNLPGREGLIVEKPIELLLDLAAASELAPGGACASCLTKGCKFNDDFETKVNAWMKAKQELEITEASLREHLIYRGPTKCGMHTVYMRQSSRRDFVGSKKDWIAQMKEAYGEDFLSYLKPDTVAVAKSHEKGTLKNQLFYNFFKESKSFSIATTLSL